MKQYPELFGETIPIEFHPNVNKRIFLIVSDGKSEKK